MIEQTAYHICGAQPRRPCLPGCRAPYFVHGWGFLSADRVIQALLTSKGSAESHLNSLVSCTKGIIFLGTPHGGSSLADWAESLARYIGLLKQTNSSILEVLKADSEVLDRIQASFHAMIRTRQATQPIAITCFYEQLPLFGFGSVFPPTCSILLLWSSLTSGCVTNLRHLR